MPGAGAGPADKDSAEKANSNQGRPPLSPDWEAWVRGTPDRFRTRAHTTAALLTTVAGALTAGLLFGDARSLPAAVLLSAAAAVTLLLISTAFFVAASIRKPKAKLQSDVTLTKLERETKDMSERIQTPMSIGAFFAAGAALALLGLVGAVVVEPEEEAHRSQVLLTSAAHQGLESTCNRPLARPFVADTAITQQTGSQFVRLTLPPDTCTSDRVELVLASDDVLLVTRSNP